MANRLQNIITLTGDLGSGKSKTGKLICAKLGFDYISTGDIQRKLAAELNLTTLEMNKLAETDPDIDLRIDSIFVNLKDTEQHLVVDSRMAWHFLPASFKIMLRADIDITTERVLHDKIRKSETTAEPDYNVLKNSLIERKKSETRRFIEKYNADGTNINNFDLVVETSFISAEDVAEIIVQNHNNWCINGAVLRCWFSPRQLLPLPGETEIVPDIQEVRIIKHNDFYFLYSGHAQVASTLKNGISYLSAQLISGQDVLEKEDMKAYQYVEKHYSSSYARNWAQLHGFEFYKLCEL